MAQWFLRNTLASCHTFHVRSLTLGDQLNIRMHILLFFHVVQKLGRCYGWWFTERL